MRQLLFTFVSAQISQRRGSGTTYQNIFLSDIHCLDVDMNKANRTNIPIITSVYDNKLAIQDLLFTNHTSIAREKEATLRWLFLPLQI